MILQSGRHEGRTAEYVVLRFANSASYIACRYPDSATGREYRRLQARFDAKRFTVRCHRCRDRATRATAYRGSPHLMFWCEDCDPYGQGAESGQLVVIRTFDEAISHIQWTCGGVRSFQDAIVRELAEGKGCPKRLTQAAAVQFLR